MTVKTLADVRTRMGHLPAATRAKSTWQHVAAQLTAATRSADPVHVSVALQMVLSMEGIECRPK
jgi:hypothetical protein